MSLEIEATYENGVLKPDQPLPLNEHERVTVIAVVRSQGLTHLASNDSDFDRVPGITRYAPV